MKSLPRRSKLIKMSDEELDRLIERQSYIVTGLTYALSELGSPRGMEEAKGYWAILDVLNPARRTAEVLEQEKDRRRQAAEKGSKTLELPLLTAADVENIKL